MRKYIDIDVEERITEFVYTNQCIDIEGVREATDPLSSCVELFDYDGSQYHLYLKDIPKMVKALEAAYEEWDDG